MRTKKKLNKSLYQIKSLQYNSVHVNSIFKPKNFKIIFQWELYFYHFTHYIYYICTTIEKYYIIFYTYIIYIFDVHVKYFFEYISPF